MKKKAVKWILLGILAIISVCVIIIFTTKRKDISADTLITSLKEYGSNNTINSDMSVNINTEMSSEWLGSNTGYFLPENVIAPDVIDIDFINTTNSQSNDDAAYIETNIEYNVCGCNKSLDKGYSYLDRNKKVLYESFDNENWYKMEYTDSSNMELLSEFAAAIDNTGLRTDNKDYILEGNIKFKDIVNIYTNTFDDIIPDITFPIEISFDESLRPYKLEISASDKTSEYSVTVDIIMNFNNENKDIIIPEDVQNKAIAYDNSSTDINIDEVIEKYKENK